MIATFDQVFNWAEAKGVNAVLWRDDDGDWLVTLNFHDSSGMFRGLVNTRMLARKFGSKPESEADWAKRVEKTLSDACVEARRQRIVANTRRPIVSSKS